MLVVRVLFLEILFVDHLKAIQVGTHLKPLLLGLHSLLLLLVQLLQRLLVVILQRNGLVISDAADVHLRKHCLYRSSGSRLLLGRELQRDSSAIGVDGLPRQLLADHVVCPYKIDSRTDIFRLLSKFIHIICFHVSVQLESEPLPLHEFVFRDLLVADRGDLGEPVRGTPSAPQKPLQHSRIPIFSHHRVWLGRRLYCRDLRHHARISLHGDPHEGLPNSELGLLLRKVQQHIYDGVPPDLCAPARLDCLLQLHLIGKLPVVLNGLDVHSLGRTPALGRAPSNTR
mmetsp:Transcript_75594/g.204350  ORF Transcript_75594/g.204350 Transcript_75594/m.204350 type:complete len:285 (+) Transcript_75594:516-1370(+)